MAPHPIFAEVERRSAQLTRGHDTYTGGPKYFHHLGNKREAAYPWLSDVEIASEVRMLMRNDIAHEMIVCAARDRILHLSEENERLRKAIDAIKAATLDPEISKDTIWFSTIETLHDYCESVLNPQPTT